MWKTDGTKATWNSQFQMDLANPNAGVKVHGARVLCTHWRGTHAGLPLNLVESYVRGQDCIANYAPIPPDQVQPQIYWRGSFDPAKNATGLEMIVSMQTSLLDSDPLVAIVSELPAGEELSWCDREWQPIGGGQARLERDKGHSGLFLLRPENADWSYAEAVFPSDFVQTDRLLSRSHPLFAERLEKGVIRRGRVAGWLLPRERDQELALALWNTFCQSPPPLTA